MTGPDAPGGGGRDRERRVDVVAASRELGQILLGQVPDQEALRDRVLEALLAGADRRGVVAVIRRHLAQQPQLEESGGRGSERESPRALAGHVASWWAVRSRIHELDPDPVLHRFDDAAGDLLLDGEVVGRLACAVDVGVTHPGGELNQYLHVAWQLTHPRVGGPRTDDDFFYRGETGEEHDLEELSRCRFDVDTSASDHRPPRWVTCQVRWWPAGGGRSLLRQAAYGAPDAVRHC